MNHFKQRKWRAQFFILLAALAGFQHAPESQAAVEEIGIIVIDEEIGTVEIYVGETRQQAFDILKPVNYLFYYINDPVQRFVMKPVGIGWSYVFPRKLRHGINNVFNNLVTPFSSLNNALQGKWGEAGTEIERFGINTTAGVLGLNDFALKYLEIEAQPEDFGQTFGKWGIPGGPFLMLPLLGPTTLRDLPSTFTAQRDGVEWYRGETVGPIRYAAGFRLFTINGKSLTYNSYNMSRERAEEAGVKHYEYLRDNYVDGRQRKAQDLPPREN